MRSCPREAFLACRPAHHDHVRLEYMMRLNAFTDRQKKVILEGAI
jgi:hypothetical protein